MAETGRPMAAVVLRARRGRSAVALQVTVVGQHTPCTKGASGGRGHQAKNVPFQTHLFFLQNQTLQKVQNQTLRFGFFQTLEKQNQTLERDKIRHLSEANQTHKTSKIRHIRVHNQTLGSTRSDTWEYTIRHLRAHNQTHKTSKIRHIGVQDQAPGVQNQTPGVHNQTLEWGESDTSASF